VAVRLGIIGDFASKLFNTIWNGIKWIGQQIANMFQGLIDILVAFMDLIFALVASLFYFLFKLGHVVIDFFQLIFNVLKILWSFVVGIGKTLASLSYTPRSSSNTGYSEMLSNIFDSLSYLQIDVIAYIALFIIWFSTGFGAIKILSSIKGGD